MLSEEIERDFCLFSRDLQHPLPSGDIPQRGTDCRGAVSDAWIVCIVAHIGWPLSLLDCPDGVAQVDYVLSERHPVVQNVHGAGLYHHAVGRLLYRNIGHMLDLGLLVPRIDPHSHQAKEKIPVAIFVFTVTFIPPPAIVTRRYRIPGRLLGPFHVQGFSTIIVTT